jgi:glycosyltransferase involved in cell wall biosynthesis
MRITVAICTWNRAWLLEQTLDQMTRLRVPDTVDWELLVVDNNSTDNTANVIAAFRNRLPVRRLFEPTPGQTNARNCALREVTGNYIIWTDDDVLVEPEWLSAYAEAFVRYPTAGFFGGVIHPWFPNVLPEWLRRGFAHVSTAYAVLDLGPDARRLTAGQRMPFGANMAFRTQEQLAFPFNPSLGLHPGSV